MEELDNRPGLHKRQLTQETMTKSGLIEDCQNCREPQVPSLVLSNPHEFERG
jgi:hypothetical protein